jgi:hypothetical protein
MAALGVGALAAYALSSPRRRAQLAAAGQSALDAGSRLAGASAEKFGITRLRRTGALESSLEKSTARQPETFRDEAQQDKIVEIGADKTRAPIHGLDAPERPGR